MKVILEIENDFEAKVFSLKNFSLEDMQRVERFLKFLQPTLIRNTLEKANKRREFLDFVDNEAIHVQQVTIPSREERNAR